MKEDLLSIAKVSIWQYVRFKVSDIRVSDNSNDSKGVSSLRSWCASPAAPHQTNPLEPMNYYFQIWPL